MATRLTELEAVNQILSLLGRRPVSSLNPADLVADASFALAELRHQSRLQQLKGWHFNSERAVLLPKNVDGRVPLTDDIARVDNAKRAGPIDSRHDMIMRVHPTDGMCLYDKNADLREEDPFDFSDTTEVRVDLVRLLDFEETPDSFRHYVTIRAGRAVQARLITDPALYRFSSDDEMHALIVLKKEELDTSDANALNQRWMRRRSPLSWLESL
jgi:hypothetical protein